MPVYILKLTFRPGQSYYEFDFSRFTKIENIKYIKIDSWSITLTYPPNPLNGLPSCVNITTNLPFFRNSSSVEYSETFSLTLGDFKITPAMNYRFYADHCRLISMFSARQNHKMPSPLRFYLTADPIFGYTGTTNLPGEPSNQVTVAEDSTIQLFIGVYEQDIEMEQELNRRMNAVRSEVNTFANV